MRCWGPPWENPTRDHHTSRDRVNEGGSGPTDGDNRTVYLLPLKIPGPLRSNPQLSPTSNPAFGWWGGWGDNLPSREKKKKKAKQTQNPCSRWRKGRKGQGLQNSGVGDGNLRQCRRCRELQGGPGARGDPARLGDLSDRKQHTRVSEAQWATRKTWARRLEGPTSAPQRRLPGEAGVLKSSGINVYLTSKTAQVASALPQSACG